MIKALKVSVGNYFPPERGSHRLEVPFGSDNLLNFPPELLG